MAGEIPNLQATARTGTGKGAARQARRDGKVPGVVYGGGEEPIAIEMPFNVLLKRLKQGRFLSTLFNLQVEGQEDVRVICRGVQRDVVKDLPTHIDFMRLRRTSKVKLFIPVAFENEETSVGLKKGGTLTVVRNEIELLVTAGEIPDTLIVDLADKDIGETINLSDLTLPEGVKSVIDRDFVVASISSPSGISASSDEDEAEGEEAATAEE